MIDLKKHKSCFFGIQESGKTYLAKKLYKQFKKPIVFMVNDDDGWSDLKNIYVYKANRLKDIRAEFNKFIKKCRDWVLQDKIDLIIIDEADLFFTTNWDLTPEFQDLILNHRHIGKNGVALWFVTRRPQDIPTKIVESSKFLFIFKLEGANALKKFNEIDSRIPPLIEKLDYNKHNFVYKELGKEPVVHKPI